MQKLANEKSSSPFRFVFSNRATYIVLMKTMSLTIRKFPVLLRSALKRRARAHQRSLSGEALQVLASALTPVDRLSEAELIRRINSIDIKTRLSLDETRQAIHLGRK